MGEKRRALAVFVLVATIIVAVVAPGRALAQAAAKPPSPPIKLNLGWQPTTNGARYFVAQANRLFEQAGLEPTLIKFTAGPPFFSAFQSGSIDVGFMGFQPAVTAVAQGIPIKVIALENDAWGAEGLVVRADSGIKTLADMRGKTIATKRGSSADTAIRAGLRKAGLKDGDVNIVDVDVTALVPAFIKGDIHGGWYWEPWMGLLKRQGGTVIAVDRDVDVPVGIVWVAREAWIRENPGAVQRLLHAIDLATDPLRKNPKAVAAEIAKPLGLSEEHVLEAITKEAHWPTLVESLGKAHQFSIHPEVIAANGGLAGVFTDNAKFQTTFGIIKAVPDFTKAIDPAHVAKYVNERR
jgi:aliphatic sulfonates family ABC transporter substrate-binding protein